MCNVIVNPNGRVLYASQCTLYTNMITRNFQLKFYLQHLLSPEFLGLYEFTDHYIYNVFWFDPYSQFSAYIFLFTRYWCNFKMLFISLSHVISSKNNYSLNYRPFVHHGKFAYFFPRHAPNSPIRQSRYQN